MQNVRHFLAAEFALQSDGRERALAVDNGAYINVQKSLFNANSFAYKHSFHSASKNRCHIKKGFYSLKGS